MNARLVMVIIILVSVGVGASALQGQGPAVNHVSTPFLTRSEVSSISTSNSTNLTGIAGQIWNVTWPPLSGIAIYFENVTGLLFNDTVIWFTLIMQTWTASVSGFGLWSFPFLVAILGITFIGVSLTLAVGDAARDMVEG